MFQGESLFEPSFDALPGHPGNPNPAIAKHISICPWRYYKVTLAELVTSDLLSSRPARVLIYNDDETLAARPLLS
jgi:hypothetical protein